MVWLRFSGTVAATAVADDAAALGGEPVVALRVVGLVRLGVASSGAAGRETGGR
jgi:hypothetical protein